MENEVRMIGGDGGPAIVLQVSAAMQWQGAADFDQSLMSGGSTETDYDVVCRCEDGVSLIERYDRHMLVLSDSEWGTCFAPSASDEIILVQWFGFDGTLSELVSQTTAAPPSATLGFTMCDPALRLLVGADDGNGEMYGFSEVSVFPGEYMCLIYYSEEAQVVILKKAESDPAVSAATH
jgi:hypothetical protein